MDLRQASLKIFRRTPKLILRTPPEKLVEIKGNPYARSRERGRIAAFFHVSSSKRGTRFSPAPGLVSATPRPLDPGCGLDRHRLSPQCALAHSGPRPR